MERAVADGTQVLIPPDSSRRKGIRPGWDGGLYAFMRRVLATERGSESLPTTTTTDRAGVRQHQVQPQDRALPATRQISGSHGMAPDQRHPQPAQAPPPSARHRGRLTAADRRAHCPDTPFRRQPRGLTRQRPGPAHRPPLRNENRRGYLQVNLTRKERAGTLRSALDAAVEGHGHVKNLADPASSFLVCALLTPWGAAKRIARPDDSFPALSR
jgi:hypothetical protein